MVFPDPGMDIVKFWGTIFSRMVLSDATLLLLDHLKTASGSPNNLDKPNTTLPPASTCHMPRSGRTMNVQDWNTIFQLVISAWWCWNWWRCFWLFIIVYPYLSFLRCILWLHSVWWHSICGDICGSPFFVVKRLVSLFHLFWVPPQQSTKESTGSLKEWKAIDGKTPLGPPSLACQKQADSGKRFPAEL